MATKYKYDKDTDYAALMERAAQRGDNAAAAIYEQQRNAKIRGEGMTDVTQSNDYAQYLPLEDVPDYDDTHRRQAESLLTERDTTGQRARIDQMLDALLGEEFDYDPASDKLYAAYRQQYERQADLASANALGAAAALTGGQASTAAVAASAAPDSVAPAVLRYSTPDTSLACVPAGTTAPARPVRVSVPVARVAGLRGMPRRAQCCSRYSGSAVSGSSWRACQDRKSYRPDTAEAVALERAKWSLSLSCGAVGSRLAASRSMRCRMAAKSGMV